MTHLLQSTTLIKIDAMMFISVASLVISFFAFIVIYNKAIKNSVNKSDVDSVENKIKSYVDDKDKIQLDRSRALHHRIDDFKSDNDKEHDRIRRENADMVMGMSKQLDAIYNHLLNKK